ncbi:MAG: hypothetical protein KAH22_05215 [Thiotrichaceae bacterium]|nr:hypothetical protein [Thiotrichaceae bacterium]
MNHCPNTETIRRLCYLFAISQCGIRVDSGLTILSANIDSEKKPDFHKALKDWTGQNYTIIDPSQAEYSHSLQAINYQIIMPVDENSGIDAMKQRLAKRSNKK